MALSWVYSRDGITSVLIGASKLEQIIENLKMTEFYICANDFDNLEQEIKQKRSAIGRPFCV